jgi:hypothetical protein
MPRPSGKRSVNGKSATMPKEKNVKNVRPRKRSCEKRRPSRNENAKPEKSRRNRVPTLLRDLNKVLKTAFNLSLHNLLPLAPSGCLNLALA